MKGTGSVISGSVIDVAPPLIAFLMLALAFYTFTYDRLFDGLLALISPGTPVSGAYVSVAIVAILLPLAFLRIWNNGLINMVIFISWALYLPSVLYFSGIDPFRILDFSLDFSLLSSKLPPAAVTAAGIVLACGSLSARSFTHIKNARNNFIGRGADKRDADHALYRNAAFEVKVILASAVMVILIMAGVSAMERQVLGILKAAGFAYILTGLGAVVILAILFVVFLWPHKKSEKE